MLEASIKNEKMYEDLRRQGDSKQKSARAKEIGLSGYSGLTKAKLISKVRNS